MLRRYSRSLVRLQAQAPYATVRTWASDLLRQLGRLSSAVPGVGAAAADEEGGPPAHEASAFMPNHRIPAASATEDLVEAECREAFRLDGAPRRAPSGRAGVLLLTAARQGACRTRRG